MKQKHILLYRQEQHLSNRTQNIQKAFIQLRSNFFHHICVSALPWLLFTGKGGGQVEQKGIAVSF